MTAWIWTPDRLAELNALRARGLGCTKCARLLHTTKAAVIGALHRQRGYNRNIHARNTEVAAPRRPTTWSEAALTERWADRKRRKEPPCSPPS